MTRLLIFASISFLGVAPVVSAQSTPSPSARHEQGSPESVPDPQRHLSDAQQRLDNVPPASLNEDGRKKLDQLRADFAELKATYEPHASASPGSASGIPSAAPDRGFADWNRKFSDVERDLVVILGAGSSLSPTSATAVGTNVGGSAGQIVAGESGTPLTGNVATVPGGATTSQAPKVGAGSVPTPTAPAPDNNAANSAANGASPGVPPTGSNPGQAATTAAGSFSAAGAAGSPSATAAPSGTVVNAGTVATGANAAALAGVAAAEIGIRDLDPRVRTELEQVRTSVELFYDAATRVGVRQAPSAKPLTP